MILLSHEDEVNTDFVTYFYRAFKGNTGVRELHDSLVQKKSNFISILEEARARLRADDPLMAWQKISQLSPRDSSEKAELLLELSRYHLFTENYLGVLEQSDLALKEQDLSLTTKLTFHQIRGLAYLRLKKFDSSFFELNKAIELAKEFPKASSGFTAHTVLAQLFAEMGNWEAYSKIALKIDDLVESSSNLGDWIEKKINQYRSIYHYHRCLGLKEDLLIEPLLVARELAEWNQLLVTKRYCNDDLKKHGYDEAGADRVFKIAGFSYLRKYSLILNWAEHRAFRLADPSIQKKILEKVIENPIDQDNLIEFVWGLNNPSRFRDHLRSTICKLRQKLPKGFLVTRGGKISLL